jgi:phosphate acyltransferase
MEEKMVIAVDAMGGDNAPTEVVKGAVLSLSNPKIHIILVGKEEKIREELNKLSYEKSRIEIVNASETIGFDEIPTVAMKEKKDASMFVGLKLLKEKKAEAFVSAGNTGALLIGATLTVGRIKGIERPVLATLLPNEKGYTFLLDCGANVDSKPEYLVQFAKMGSIYMENVLKIEKPKVALLNIGTEVEKGNMLTKATYPLLENTDLNFIGNVEARQVPTGIADVLVCDGFVGNIMLKYTEGLSTSLFLIIKRELLSNFMSKIGAIFAKKSFSNIKKNFDYSEIGGAPFLGLKSLVVKAHGSSNDKAIKGAIFQCIKFIENDIPNKIEQKLQ